MGIFQYPIESGKLEPWSRYVARQLRKLIRRR